jgi:hypothetical protein
MKKEKAKAGLILGSVVTASVAGLSQATSTAAASFLGNLGQTIKDGAAAAAKGIWEKSKEIISTNEVIKNCALAATFILPIKYLPGSAWEFIGKGASRVASTAYSALKSSSLWGSLLIGATAVAAVRKIHSNWKKAVGEEAIKKNSDSQEQVLEKAVKDRGYLEKLRQNPQVPPQGGYSSGSNNIYINTNGGGLDLPYDYEVNPRGNSGNQNRIN